MYLGGGFCGYTSESSFAFGTRGIVIRNPFSSMSNSRCLGLRAGIGPSNGRRDPRVYAEGIISHSVLDVEEGPAVQPRDSRTAVSSIRGNVSRPWGVPTNFARLLAECEALGTGYRDPPADESTSSKRASERAL